MFCWGIWKIHNDSLMEVFKLYCMKYKHYHNVFLLKVEVPG